MHVTLTAEDIYGGFRHFINDGRIGDVDLGLQVAPEVN